MIRLSAIRHLDVAHPLSGDRAFVTAASGLVRLGDFLCVVADDAHYLAIFQLSSQLPGQIFRLLPGDLPSDAAARKAAKPDFEILLQLPIAADASRFRLLAMGSGSTARRMRGAIVDLSPDGSVCAVTTLDLRPLFTSLARLCAQINLEGAAICGDRLILFNRGNSGAPTTAIFSTDLHALLADDSVAVLLEKEFQLPCIDGVPLTVTDAFELDDGTVLLSTVAEATSNAYADGAVIGAAFVVLDQKFDVVHIDQVDPMCKIEGITAQRNSQGTDIYCVSDADDPDRPASLYRTTMRI
jgi:hypothetical protein